MSVPRLHKEQQAILEPLIPSLKVGAATGISGFLVGGGIGILRSAHPGLVAIFTGTQFFVLGSSFFYTRDVIQRTAFAERTRKSDLISSSTAGAISGAAAGAFYGKINSITGAIFVGTFAHLGQRYIHSRADIEPKPRDRRPYLDRLADSKWVPFRSISHSEYETMLTEKLLKVDAEVRMIDEKITALRSDTTDGDTTREKP